MNIDDLARFFAEALKANGIDPEAFATQLLAASSSEVATVPQHEPAPDGSSGEVTETSPEPAVSADPEPVADVKAENTPSDEKVEADPKSEPEIRPVGQRAVALLVRERNRAGLSTSPPLRAHVGKYARTEFEGQDPTDAQILLWFSKVNKNWLLSNRDLFVKKEVVEAAAAEKAVRAVETLEKAPEAVVPKLEVPAKASEPVEETAPDLVSQDLRVLARARIADARRGVYHSRSVALSLPGSENISNSLVDRVAKISGDLKVKYGAGRNGLVGGVAAIMTFNGDDGERLFRHLLKGTIPETWPNVRKTSQNTSKTTATSYIESPKDHPLQFLHRALVRAGKEGLSDDLVTAWLILSMSASLDEVSFSMLYRHPRRDPKLEYGPGFMPSPLNGPKAVDVPEPDSPTLFDDDESEAPQSAVLSHPDIIPSVSPVAHPDIIPSEPKAKPVPVSVAPVSSEPVKNNPVLTPLKRPVYDVPRYVAAAREAEENGLHNLPVTAVSSAAVSAWASDTLDRIRMHQALPGVRAHSVEMAVLHAVAPVVLRGYYGDGYYSHQQLAETQARLLPLLGENGITHILKSASNLAGLVGFVPAVQFTFTLLAHRLYPDASWVDDFLRGVKNGTASPGTAALGLSSMHPSVLAHQYFRANGAMNVGGVAALNVLVTAWGALVGPPVSNLAERLDRVAESNQAPNASIRLVRDILKRQGGTFTR